MSSVLRGRCAADRLHHILTPGMAGSRSIDQKVVVVLAFPGIRHTGATLEAKLGGQPPLSVRAAMICILSLSVVGWAAILLPLWAVAQ
jgi:hypothetical protein